MAMKFFQTEFTKEKVAAELYRRELSERVARWAMITRKMKKQEPSGDAVTDYSDFLTEIYYQKGINYPSLLPGLIMLLSSKKEAEIRNSTLLLRTVMSSLQNSVDKTIVVELITAFVRVISSQIYEARTIRFVLDVIDTIIVTYWYNDLVVEAGVIPILVKIMSSFDGLANNISWCLYHIYGTSGDTGEMCRAACISAGAIPVIRVLREHTGVSEYSKEQLSRVIRHYEKFYAC
jgi:hypothetical protein